MKQWIVLGCLLVGLGGCASQDHMYQTQLTDWQQDIAFINEDGTMSDWDLLDINKDLFENPQKTRENLSWELMQFGF